MKLIAALPLLSPHPNVPREIPNPVPGACAAAGVTLFRSNDARPILLRARYAAGLFSILLAILLFVAVREMFGAAPALFALSLAIFEPNLLANGALVTTDMAATSMLFGTAYAFWRFTERPTVARMLVCGAAAGFTLASKHSGVLVFPILLVLGTVEWLKPKPDGFLALRRLRSRAGVLLAALLVITVVALLVLWAFYEFRYQARPAPLTMSLPLSVRVTRLSPRFAAKMLLGAANLHLLPEAYLFGLANVLLQSQSGGPSFLLGKWTPVGSWRYFPLTFLIKSTSALSGASPDCCGRIADWKIFGAAEHPVPRHSRSDLLFGEPHFEAEYRPPTSAARVSVSDCDRRHGRLGACPAAQGLDRGGWRSPGVSHRVIAPVLSELPAVFQRTVGRHEPNL